MSEVPLYSALKGIKVSPCGRASLKRQVTGYRGTSPIRKRLPLGPYNRAMPRALLWS